MEELVREINKLIEESEKKVQENLSEKKRLEGLKIQDTNRMEEVVELLSGNTDLHDKIRKKLLEFYALDYIVSNKESLSLKFGLTKEQNEIYDKMIELFKRCMENSIQKITLDNEKLNDDKKMYFEVNDELNSEEFFDKTDEFMMIMDKIGVSDKEKYDLLKEILEKNNKLFMSKMGNSMENDYDKIVSLFFAYGYDFDKLDVEFRNKLREYGNYNNILGMLKRIEKYSFIKNNSALFMNLILYSSLDIIDNIENISNKYGISFSDLCMRYPGVFIPNDVILNDKIIGCYDDFLEVIPVIRENSLDVGRIINYMGAEIIDSKNRNLIFSNIKLAKMYGFTPNGLRSGIYPFAKGALNSKNTFTSVDRFIELSNDGLRYAETAFSKMAVNVMDLIIKIKLVDRDDVFRDRVVKDTGSAIVINMNRINQVTNMRVDKYKESLYNVNQDILGSGKFYEVIRDNYNDEIDMKYINNNEFLTRIMEDGKVSLIGGVRVSSLKVLRLYTTLCKNGYDDENALLYAISYGSLLNQEEFKKIKDEVMAFYQKRGTR